MFPMTFSFQRLARRARREEATTEVVTVRVAEATVQDDELQMTEVPQGDLQAKAETLADTIVERLLFR